MGSSGENLTTSLFIYITNSLGRPNRAYEIGGGLSCLSYFLLNISFPLEGIPSSPSPSPKPRSRLTSLGVTYSDRTFHIVNTRPHGLSRSRRSPRSQVRGSGTTTRVGPPVLTGVVREGGRERWDVSLLGTQWWSCNMLLCSWDVVYFGVAEKT